MKASAFYSILGVSKAATKSDLKIAYKKAALKWHPDRFVGKSEEERAGAEAKFKEMAAAYDVLSDDQKRATYDRYGEAGLKRVPTPGAAGGKSGRPFFDVGVPFSFSGGHGAAPDAGMSPERAAEIFAQIFGGNGMMFGAPVGGVEGAGRKRGGCSLGGGLDGLAGLGGYGGLDGFAKRHAGASSPGSTLPRGTLVQLLRLRDTSHEGTVGHIEGYDGVKCRYTVVLARTGELILVPPTNVRQVAFTSLALLAHCTVIGHAQPALNGQRPTSAVYDPTSGRYRCDGLSEKGVAVLIEKENLVLPKSTRVSIEGVLSRPALNGKIASIVEIDRSAQRYLVRLENDEMMRLRFGAVAAC